jgi:MoaA/NifB/PqqE/SkfB family radical SAM enzyme
MLDSIKGFHIETTNICTLKCPGCARTQFIKSFPKQWKNKQLSLIDLKKFIDIDINKKIFNLCGNYGDTIYYDDLFNLIKWIKQNGGMVEIGTNGSYKNKKWWKELCSLLTFDDRIIFAIDGVPENFTNYRINADWPSIQEGIVESVKATQVIWKFIPFAYNQDHVAEAERMAKELGIHSFLVDPSDRWDEHTDQFKPTKLLGPRSEHVLQWDLHQDTTITPKCKTTNLEHYISAHGYYMPCCYVGDHRFYYSSEFYKNKKMYDISNITLTSVLENLETFYQSIEQNKLKYCTFNCPKT